MKTTQIGILGTGPVGKALAAKLSSLGNAVMVGTRDVQATMARNDNDSFGNPAFRTWHEQNPTVKVGTLKEAAVFGGLVINALSGLGTLEGLRQARAANITGKILIDVSNPLDFSKGMPPSLTVSNTDSLGEQIQRELPGARVVKTLNTVNAYLQVDPQQLAGGEHSIFVSGNDAAAKEEVTKLLKEGFGWKDVIDLGDISTARGTEMFLALWSRLYGALNNPMFTIRVVR
ncbi:MAG TPA: NAD(P)-binding domain-containing protein [Thermoleophilia bacterium]|nr:NAD(P)-binding domain-containing protein [Thermoleophilia bacterium]